MNDYQEEEALVRYIWNNFGQLRTIQENRAAMFLMLTEKACAMGEDGPAFYRSRIEEFSGPDTEEFLRGGREKFRRSVVQRILSEHGSSILICRCPDCDRVVITPNAKQCLWCGKDWH